MAGLCGCPLRIASIVAVVFSAVQSIFGIIVGTMVSMKFAIAIIVTESPFSHYTHLTKDFEKSKGIAEAHIAFNFIWLSSSAILIVAIIKSHPWLHRQWTIVTACVLVTDVIMFIVVCTQIKNLYDPAYNKMSASYNLHMILLLCTLSRFGIIGLVCDICLAVLVIKRAAEIIPEPQQTGYVIAPPGQHNSHLMQPGPTMIIQGQPMYAQPVQQMYVQPGQQMYVQPGQQMYAQPGQPDQQAYPTPNNQQQPPAYNSEYKDGGSELVKK